MHTMQVSGPASPLQTFVADAGHNYSAPYWMGEFGCGGDSENWEKIVRWMNLYQRNRLHVGWQVPK